MDKERSHSGLVRSLGKRVYRKVSRVRIPPSPQFFMVYNPSINMIKAIIFDFGGVVYEERWDLVLQELQKIDKRITLEKFKTVFYQRWDEYKVGLLEKTVFWSSILSYLGLENSKNNILKISSSFSKIWATCDKSIIQIIEELKKNYLVFGLTTSCYENEERLVNDKKVFALFEKIYMSHREAKKKPDQEAYLNILKENNLLAEECVFIDNKQQNIKIAQILGINSVLYKNPKQLKIELKNIGLNI